MGLRCLLGHDFNEPEVEREREEDGNEVVTTVREVKTCTRCGETQIVSENTEVTTMERLTEAATSAPTPEEPAEPEGGVHPGGVGAAEIDEEPYEPPVDGDDAVIIDAEDDGPESTTAGASTDSVEPAADMEGTAVDGEEVAEKTDDVDVDAEEPDGVVDDDAEFIESGPGEAELGPDTAEGPADWPDPGTDPDGSEDVPDDGEILDDDAGGSSPDRERGAWPELDQEEKADHEPTPWPDQRGEDEGWSATVDDGDDAGPGVEFGGGLTPEATVDGADVDEDVEFIDAPETSASAGDKATSGGIGTETDDAADGDVVGSGIAREDPPSLQTSADDIDMEYYCPACEMTWDAAGNSMRAGDICPECKRGYVNERPR
ncbi:DUF7093 family protein [Halorubrum vacuolatum]|uniref:Uncharacterized protein n=1 Tax=Halorubrum vacuolatum TaxID=63740 RepID=A0A238WQJ4_HALVU|nr:hypothetical protein [Halorubrum vacuolatum]SNR48805.1 hypothetical protein SAMN06264855_10979 [Halorubrum vacuolatum]